MKQGLKIEFGCNGRTMDGWIGTDIDTCDIRKLPLPWADESCSQLYASHIYEHVSCSEGVQFLADCHRILVPGGALRLVVPVVGVHLQRGHARDLIQGHGHIQALDRNIILTSLWAAGFDLPNIEINQRTDLDVHWKTIGKEKDDAESLYINATK